MNICIILNYKKAQITSYCVKSILEHCKGIDKIIVVDNCSQDGSYEYLKDEFSKNEKIITLESNYNGGYSVGNNFGIKWAESNLDPENFWILNNDTFVVDDAFRDMQVKLKNEDTLVGSVLINDHNNKVQCIGGGKSFPILGKSKLIGKNLDIEEINKYKARLNLDYIMGCSVAFSKKTLDKLGYFEEMFFMYSDDLDWGIKAKKMNIKLDVALHSHVYHSSRDDDKNKTDTYYFYNSRSIIMLNKKHFGLAFAFTSLVFLNLISFVKEFMNPKLFFTGLRGSVSGLRVDNERL